MRQIEMALVTNESVAAGPGIVRFQRLEVPEGVNLTVDRVNAAIAGIGRISVGDKRPELNMPVTSNVAVYEDSLEFNLPADAAYPFVGSLALDLMHRRPLLFGGARQAIVTAVHRPPIGGTLQQRVQRPFDHVSVDRKGVMTMPRIWSLGGMTPYRPEEHQSWQPY